MHLEGNVRTVWRRSQPLLINLFTSCFFLQCDLVEVYNLLMLPFRCRDHWILTSALLFLLQICRGCLWFISLLIYIIICFEHAWKKLFHLTNISSDSGRSLVPILCLSIDFRQSPVAFLYDFPRECFAFLLAFIFMHSCMIKYFLSLPKSSHMSLFSGEFSHKKKVLFSREIIRASSSVFRNMWLP